MFLNLGSRQRDRDADHYGKKVVNGRLHTIFLPSRDGDEDAMTIRLADNQGQRNRANVLLKRMYSWRGYGTNQQIATTPNSVTFTATSDNDVIGTLTLTVDSSAGLACDKTFSDEMNRFRTGGRTKLCELTKFAFDTSLPARPRLAALFHIIFIYGSLHFDCTDLFIEVNPRHRRFYEVMLGFTPVGSPRVNLTVNAPSQLMWLNVGNIRQQINKYAGDPRVCSRSLYGHFFSAKEEVGIYNRLEAAKRSQDRDKRKRIFQRMLERSVRSSSLNEQRTLAAA